MLALLSVSLAVPSALAQGPTHRRVQISAVPALNYSSDEGFGYGVVAGLYGYRAGAGRYDWAFEPTLFFTTGGRREVSAMVDAPDLIGGRVRLTAFGAYEDDCCHPYFGGGNSSAYDPGLASGDGPSFYTYQRTRWSLVADLQWRVTRGVRLLLGAAAHHNASATRDPNTAFALDSAAGRLSASDFSAASIGPKVGAVLDTRDRERDPSRGAWADAIVWHGWPAVGSDHEFTRLSGTLRGYVPAGPHFTIAGRFVGEHIAGSMPASMLPDIASSFRDYPGVGGARSVRGVLRERFLGTTRVLANLELRWRGRPFALLGQRWRVGAVAFVDGGRVWHRAADDDGGPHVGEGAGLRVTWGEDFIVAADVARGSEAGVQVYIRLGHLF